MPDLTSHIDTDKAHNAMQVARIVSAHHIAVLGSIQDKLGKTFNT